MLTINRTAVGSGRAHRTPATPTTTTPIITSRAVTTTQEAHAARRYRRACVVRAAEQEGPAAHARPPRPSPPSSMSTGMGELDRRSLVGLLSGVVTTFVGTQAAEAVQGGLAGRIPGLSREPGSDGYLVYTRPEQKSGGHGVGWQEIPRYSFKIPPGWDEIPVSIADLGGTEVDLRYKSLEEGDMCVVVAPLRRFVELGDRTDVDITEIGDPDTIIGGFALELFKNGLEEGDVLETRVENHDGKNYYYWELKPHRLVTATATGNRIFILSVIANSVKWRKYSKDLLTIQNSFRVPNQPSDFRSLRTVDIENA